MCIGVLVCALSIKLIFIRSSSRIGREKNQQGDGQHQIQIQRYIHSTQLLHDARH